MDAVPALLPADDWEFVFRVPSGVDHLIPTQLDRSVDALLSREYDEVVWRI